MNRIFDISMPLSADTPVWPGGERFKLSPVKNMRDHGVNESSICLNVHTGTHLDAPYHFFESGKRAGDIPLEIMVGIAVVIEYHGKSHITPDFLETVRFPAGCTKILFKTRNSSVATRLFTKDFTAVSAEAAEWIVQKGIRLVGIDYLSIQPIDEPDNRTHKLLLNNNVAILEGLCLKDVIPGVYTLVALPLKISDAEGVPVRAILIADDGGQTAVKE